MKVWREARCQAAEAGSVTPDRMKAAFSLLECVLRAWLVENGHLPAQG